MPRLRPPPAPAVALEYARAGIRIFPVAHDKRPLVTDWVNASSADETRIRELWTTHPKALIGVPLKHLNAFALDVDRHQGGADGVDHLNKLVAEHGELPPGPVTETANNGRHYFFKQPDGEPIGNRKLAGGLETRGFRSDNSGGYVVGAGSWLPDGRAWRLAAGAPSLLKLIANGGLPQAPDWLINLARGQSKPDPDPARQKQTADRGQSGAREQAYAAASLDGIARDLAATQRGNRNNVLNVAALKLGTMAARGWIGRSTVEGCLFDAAIANGLVKDDSARSVRGTIKSGLEAGLKSPHEDLEDRERPRAGSLADAGADEVSVWPPDFQMGPKGLTVQVIKGSGSNTTVEEIWLAAPFEILGRVRDPESRGWARLLRWRDDDGRVHQQTVGDADLHGDAAALCSALAARGLRITTTTSRASTSPRSIDVLLRSRALAGMKSRAS
jgi:Bifunctional DNA primase/polymerase, N-terminal/Domain of unknown function (DUF927)